MNGIKYASLVTLLATACATAPDPIMPQAPIGPTKEQLKIASWFGVTYNHVAFDLPGGYTTKRTTLDTLVPIAETLSGNSIYRGRSVQVEGRDGKTITRFLCSTKTQGDYSSGPFPAEMKTVLEESDADGNKKIDETEALRFVALFCKAFVQGFESQKKI